MTPKRLFGALVDVVRVLYGRQALVVTPRSVAACCGWTSESLVEAMGLAGITLDQVLQVAQGYPRRVVARVAGRQGLYDAPALADEPASDLARRIAQTLRPSQCALEPTLLAQIQAKEVQVPLVQPRPHTPRPIPPRRRSKKTREARGFKDLVTHSLLESRQERVSRTEEALLWMAQEAEGEHKASKRSGKAKVRGSKAVQRLLLHLRENRALLDQGTFLGLDVETTDNSTEHGRVIELGAVAFVGWQEVGHWCWRFDPQGRRISRRAFQIHGIHDAELEGQLLFANKAKFIWDLMRRAGAVVAHNLPYDKRMVSAELERAGLGWPEGVVEICTAQASKAAEPERTGHRLDGMCAQYQIPLTNHHAAEDDARACGLLWRHLYSALTGLEANASAQEEVA